MKNQKGFTLIELLLVLAIIGIIAAIAIPALLGQREKAKAKAVQSLVANVAGELARVNDDLRAKAAAGTTVKPSSVVAAVLNLSNYKYPAVKNPYGGTATPYKAAAGQPTNDGEVNLDAQSNYSDPATANLYPAVIVTGRYKNGTNTSYPTKVVALD